MMNRKKKPIRQVTAIYCRLSLEDGRDNESMSISNQKLLLSDYAEKNGLIPYVCSPTSKRVRWERS